MKLHTEDNVEVIGQNLSRYTILEKLGEGGMGCVYKARDTQLGRYVALKVLSGELVNSEWKLRLLREAQAASALNHPNIVTIYEVSSANDVHFIAMEFVRGITLDQQIASPPLNVAEALNYAIQMADALSAAHTAGIIHRDLKPSNIMITAAGQVKLLDFGLAKVGVDQAVEDVADTRTLELDRAVLTQAGVLLGTAGYMSPEQAEGKVLDRRSDMFSFGAVLYEMVSGRRAFQGSSIISTLSSILRDEPAPLYRIAGVPRDLEKIIMRCLRKEPGRRFSNMGEVKRALEEVRSGHVLASAYAPHSGLYRDDNTPSIAVLPFRNFSPDKENEYFGDGLAEEIINVLSKIEGLRVVARTSAFVFRGKEQDIRVIGEKLNVETILEGSVRRSGNRVRVTAQLVNIGDGFHVWSDHYDREMSDVFAIQDDISQAIAQQMRVHLVTPRNRPLVKRNVENIEAYDLYLRGQYYAHRYTPEALMLSKELFERALALDPNYVRAYVGLSYFYGACGWFGVRAPREVLPIAKRLAQRALDLDVSAAEAHMLMAMCLALYDLNWDQAEPEFRKAMEIGPVSTDLAGNYSVHFLIPTGRLEEALATLEQALERDPLSAQLHMNRAATLLMQRSYDGAIECYRKALEMEPNHFMAHGGIGIAYFKKGMIGEYVAACEKMREFGAGIAGTIGSLGRAYAIAGRRLQAQKLLDELLQSAAQRYVSPASIASIYLGLGDADTGFEWLEKAVEARDGPIFGLRVNPLYDDLRSDPRYDVLLRKLGLTDPKKPNQ
jgi:serine/threonine-protein kinase